MSYNVFEILKDKILSYFKVKGQNGPVKSDEEKDLKDIEESTILLDETDKSLPRSSVGLGDTKKVEIKLFNNMLVPVVYFLIGIISIGVLIVIGIVTHRSEEGLFSQIGRHRTKVYNYFKLPSISPLVYLVLVSIQSGFGCLLVYLVHSYLFMKYTVKGLSLVIRIKLQLLLITGLITMGLSYLYAICFNIPTFSSFNEPFEKYHTNLPEVIYFLHLYFSITFAIAVILFFNDVRKKQNSECFQTNDQNEKTGCYKIVLLIYIILFTIMYILTKLYKNKVILIDIESELLTTNVECLYALLPYIIFLFNSLFFLYLYDDIGSSNTTLSENELNNYNNCDKNIL
jgi:hypothetical protein